MKEEQKLKIIYSFKPRLKEYGFKMTDKLDKELEKVARKLGFKFEGSGFDFRTWKRDLEFYKKRQ